MIIAVTEIVDVSHYPWLKYLKTCEKMRTLYTQGYIPVGEEGVLNDVTRITGMEVGAGTAVDSFCRSCTGKDSLASDDNDLRRQQRPRNRLGGTEETTETCHDGWRSGKVSNQPSPERKSESL